MMNKHLILSVGFYCSFIDDRQATVNLRMRHVIVDDLGGGAAQKQNQTSAYFCKLSAIPNAGSNLEIFYTQQQQVEFCMLK